MSKDFLKRLTEAHSWLGLIISGLLFVVFFAGSISLFRDEVNQWAFQPHIPVVKTGTPLLLTEIIEHAKEGLPVKPDGRIAIIFPKHTEPYYRFTVDVIHQPGEPRRVSFLIDPYTGEKYTGREGFKLSRFIYDLHIDLNLSKAGEYVIGFVTLFFFFALVSGIFIHARKLISNFFKYRNEGKARSQLLDMHNVVGIMSLPFTLMYAISGLIFNLVIIYQVVFAVFLYKGDQDALLTDAGVKPINIEWQNTPLQVNSINQLYQQTVDKYNNTPQTMQVYNYGDESSVVRFFIPEKNSLTLVNDITYYVKDYTIHSQFDAEHGNALREGLRVLSRLHFAEFAGFDLRILYSILGIGVCALIITGNLLWIEQHSRQRNQSLKTLNFVKGYTVLSTGGLALAIAFAFLAERLLPIDMLHRADYMITSFIVTLVIIASSLFFNTNKNVYLGWLLRLSGYISLLVVLCDWVLFSEEIITLWKQGVHSIVGTEVGLILTAVLFILSGNKLINKTKDNRPIDTKEVSDTSLSNP